MTHHPFNIRGIRQGRFRFLKFISVLEPPSLNHACLAEYSIQGRRALAHRQGEGSKMNAKPQRAWLNKPGAAGWARAGLRRVEEDAPVFR